jgi:adenosyl cobinamide kinase/adenosyl cobinamide phosphate guanylyltransferase
MDAIVAVLADMTAAGDIAWEPKPDGSFESAIGCGFFAHLWETAEDEVSLLVVSNEAGQQVATSEALADGWQTRPELAGLHRQVRRAATLDYFMRRGEIACASLAG